MKNLNLREIQLEALEILEKFHQICEDNNLTYYLAYGTLLGAIRHKGFIPWDDDIDVWMPREDYKIFCNIMNDRKHNFHNLKLCGRENTENYSFYITRLSNMDFKYITTEENMKDIDIGIFIDIYPLDNYCNSKIDGDNLLNKIHIINYGYNIYNNAYSISKNIPLVFKKIIHIAYRIFYGKKYAQLVNNKIERIILENTTKEDVYIGVPSWDNFYLNFEKKDFIEKVKVEFEGKHFWIPKGYDNILKRIYNNYMTLPPKSARIPHHNYKIIKR